MSDRVWTSNKLSLFVFDGNAEPGLQYKFKNCVSVDKILWGGDVSAVCAYCGHELHKSGDCPGCGARLAKNGVLTGKAKMYLSGWMPHAAWVLDICFPDQIELTLTECGNPSVYNNWNGKIVAKHCHVIEKCIDIASMIDECEIVKLSAIIECSIEIITERCQDV